MGRLSPDQVAAALNAAGIRAERRYPGGKMPAITDVAAAVSMEKADLTQQTVTVLVEVLAPAAMGAAVCEAAALDAGEVLQQLGAQCSVAACRLDGRTGLFSAAVTAVFFETAQQAEAEGNISMKLGAVVLKHAVAFTAQRAVDKETTQLENAAYTFRLEEFFAPGDAEDATPAQPFTVTNGDEIYHNCKWISEKRETDASGTRQIREGAAERKTGT